jgi:uncharacterized protein DUF7007
MHTPWGAAQTKKVLGPGILEVSTPEHGGIHLDEEMNQRIPAYMRSTDGWYEEDVDWTIVATIFPEAFTEDQRETAERIMRNSMPAAYETFYQVVIPPGESYVKDEILFKAIHEDDYLGLAAWGDWHAKVPPGHVVVFAGRGGRGPNYRLPKDTAYFVVPEEEYDERPPFGFVIDESRHPRTKFED